MRVSKKFSQNACHGIIRGHRRLFWGHKWSNRSCDEAKFKLGGDKNLNFNQLVIFFIRSIF